MNKTEILEKIHEIKKSIKEILNRGKKKEQNE